MYTLSDFDFDLPQELIAQMPLSERSSSRLLEVGEKLVDWQFSDIVDLISPNDLLIFNDTKVIKARLFGQKQTGGVVEVLIERIFDEKNAIAKIRASKAPKDGSILRLADTFEVHVGQREGEFFTLHFPENVFDLLEQYGHTPLPPYIERQAQLMDETRYQTVYARVPGAVAAPTAGLHFDQSLIKRIQDKGVRLVYVTLHVGAGTFQPVRTENLAEHQMHTEYYSIPEATVQAINETRANGGKVISVGTTSLRALEASATQEGFLKAGNSNTQIFITPGYQFKVVDRLITNFHLPKSTLLMLVSAFSGYQLIQNAYQYAINKKYRFFSYGDAMLLDRIR